MKNIIIRALKFKSISKAGTGAYAVIIGIAVVYIDAYLDLGLGDNEITNIILEIMLLGGSILTWIGTFNRKDLSFGIFRK